jgi:membrane dipeptidase
MHNLLVMKQNKSIVILLASVLIVFSFSCELEIKPVNKTENPPLNALEIHQKVLTLDSHCDTPLWFTYDDYDFGVEHDAYETRNMVDLPRMKKGMLDASFFAVFLGQGARNDSANLKAYNEAMEIIAKIKTQVTKYSSQCALATSPDDAYRLEKESKQAIYLGLENGYPLGTDLSNIQKFYDQGIRYITLSHTRNNDICDSSTDTLAEHNGLSKFGEEVVKEMNRLGIMIDVSHISDSAFYDVIRMSETPIIASHSNARAICDSPRNLTDDMLKEIAKNNGVVQVCILNSYVIVPAPNPAKDSAISAFRERIKGYGERTDSIHEIILKEWYSIQKEYPDEMATVSDLVNHIDHIVKIAGIDHVGIGTDFDGGGSIDGCFDVSEMPNITKELVKRGYNEDDIEKIWGGNFMRVFREVEAFKE